MQISSAGVLAVDLSGTGDAAQVDVYDDYCDPASLKVYANTVGNLTTPEQREANRALMRDMGIIFEKECGRGDMVNIQPLTRLLAGGIYQNRARIDELERKLEGLNG